jgi:hypothetical protein
MDHFEKLFKSKVNVVAMKMCWDELADAGKEHYLNLAKEKVDEEYKQLALKCVEEVEEVMSKEDYLSRTDPKVYKDK